MSQKIMSLEAITTLINTCSTHSDTHKPNSWTFDARRNRAGMGKKCTEKVCLPAFQDVVLLLLLFWRSPCRRCRRSILRALQSLLILRHKKKESTSTVRMIIKFKEEDETEFLFSFRFNQFPGTLFRLKPARYLAFCDIYHTNAVSK